MSLANPDSRRALRAVIQAIIALALIGLLYWITGLLKGHAPELLSIARGCLIILGIGTLFYGAENGIRAAKIEGPAGMGMEFTGDAPAAAQAVAGAAQATADTISEQGS